MIIFNRYQESRTIYYNLLLISDTLLNSHSVLHSLSSNLFNEGTLKNYLSRALNFSNALNKETEGSGEKIKKIGRYVQLGKFGYNVRKLH